MKYCQSCGAQIPEGVSFCPNCGTSITPETPQAEEPKKQNNTPKPMVQNRSIATCIILSLVTCGIYGIVWFINLVNDVNAVCQDEKSSQSGGVVFLLTLVTCGIYGLIWFYNAGKRMEAAGSKYNMSISDNSIMYLILLLIGLGIVDYAILQTDLNKFSV